MKKCVFSIFILLTSCSTVKVDEDLSTEQSKVIDNLIDFFNQNAYDSIQKTYYSEINNEGKVTSRKIYNVALSRIIYGLSYTSKYNAENLQKAQEAADFQLKNLVEKDDLGYFFSTYTENEKISMSTEIDIWQQAYGLCGLTELYRNKPSKELLNTIHQLNDAVVYRFQDTIHGGFYGNYHFEKGQVSSSKSLQSLMYPITSYMANLWEVDFQNRKKYEPIIIENIDLLYKKAWNSKSGWVNVKFDDSWNKDSSTKIDVTPGHNFQLASLFLRAKNWDFISKQKKEIYYKRGIEILNRTITNLNEFEKGFGSLINPFNNKILDSRKTWWQHAEAIIALSFVEKEYEEELKELETFYYTTFQDFKSGGEYFYVTANNKPITTELKGSIGKSTYHTVEMIRIRNENLLK